jgi:hypothetical protein
LKERDERYISVTKGILFDFLGNFGDSARKGFPIFQLGGAAGYVWGARFDENGKGALRMTAIDASQFTAPSSVARGGENFSYYFFYRLFINIGNCSGERDLPFGGIKSGK